MSSNNEISIENLTLLRFYKQKIRDLTKKIKNLKVSLSQIWDAVNNQNTQNTPNTNLDRHIICLDLLIQIKLLEQMVSRLDSSWNYAITQKIIMDFQA